MKNKNHNGKGWSGRFCRDGADQGHPSGERGVRRRKKEEEYFGQREQNTQVMVSIRAHGLWRNGESWDIVKRLEHQNNEGEGDERENSFL